MLCALIVEAMSVAVNAILSLISVMSPHCLVRSVFSHSSIIVYFRIFFLCGCACFLNGDDVSLCVMYELF